MIGFQLQAHLVLLHVALLHFADTAFLNKWKFCGNLTTEQIYHLHCSNSIYLLHVSV